MISNLRAVPWRALVLIVASPLLLLGLSGPAHAATLALPPVVDDPDPVDPPPPCPERSDFTHPVAQEIVTPVTVERRGSGATYLVVFTLQPAHAFNPPDPFGCTGGDGVVSKLGVPSANIVSAPTILADQQTWVKELTPANLNDPMIYHFKLRFQKNFNTTNTLNPKRDARWCLNIPVIPITDPPNPVRQINPFQCQT